MHLFRRVPSISPREASERLAAGELQLVDVRERREFAAGSVPSATHIPLREVRGSLDRIDRSRPVAFLCASGHRSAMAARSALAGGLDAFNVKGGISAWEREGLPLAPKARTRSG